MFHALTALFFESMAVVLFVTCLFWAVTGVVAADYSGRSRIGGALVGGLLPVIGWALMLIPPRRPASATVSIDDRYAPPSWVEFTRRRLNRPQAAVTAVGGVAVVLLVLAFVEPWLNVGTTVASDAYAGADTAFSAAPLGIGVALMCVAVLMHARRPHGVWCVAGALTATTSLLLGMQIWLFSMAVGNLLSHVSSLIHSSERVSVGVGAGCLIGSGLVGLMWSVFSLCSTEGA